MSNRKVTVTGCHNCPFSWFGPHHSCWLGGPAEVRLELSEAHILGKAPPPQDCELRRRGIRVVLELTEVP